MEKKIGYELEGSLKVLKGAILLDRAVGSTFGPKGRNVLIKDEMGRVRFSKDGKKVSEMIVLEDPMENMGAQLLQSAAGKTAKMIGDGTTTTILLTTALYQNSIRYITSGATPSNILKGIQLGANRVKKYLEESARPIKCKEDLFKVAMVAGKGDEELASLLVDAIGEQGPDFSIHLEKSMGSKSSIERTDGFKFEGGYLSRFYITDTRRQIAEHDSPAYLVTDLKIQSLQEILPLLEEFSTQKRALAVICDGWDESVSGTLTRNIQEAKLKLVSIKVLAYGKNRQEKLKDIAVATGSTFISKDIHKDLSKITLADLGSSKKIIVDENSTLIVDGSKDKESFSSHLEGIISLLRSKEGEADRESLRTRVASLTNGLVKVELAAGSETELIERMERGENVIHALRGSIQKGVVIGGGHAYYHSREVLKMLAPLEEEIAMGIKVVIDALAVPLIRLISNAGKDPKEILGKLENRENSGYNVRSGQIENLYDAGVIDPVKTLKVALDNACSIAGLMLSSVCFVTEVNETQ